MKNKDKPLFERLDWMNTIFLLTTPIIAAAGVTLFITKGWVRWETMVFSLVMMVITGFSITGGYHRLFSHKTYEAHWIVKLFVLLFGAAAFQNGARRWSSDHRRHHKYVDTARDPYNIKEGFWYAHIGWVLLRYEDGHNYDDVPDLMRDPLVMWQEKYILPLSVGMGFLFPALVASLWGDFWGGFLFAGLTRSVLNSHFTFSINSFAHMFGKRPYNENETARDNWILAYVTYGEGYHNFHHKFPSDYRNGIKTYQWDPTKWIIQGLSWMGLTWKLKRIPDERILAARLAVEKKRVVKKIEAGVQTAKHVTPEFVEAAREKFEQAYARFDQLKQEYARLKKEKLDALSAQMETANARIDQIKVDLAQASQVLDDARDAWVQLCSGFGVRPTRAVS